VEFEVAEFFILELILISASPAYKVLYHVNIWRSFL